MAKPQFTQDQILTVVLEINAEHALKDFARKHGVSRSTLYRWRAKLADKRKPLRDHLRSLEIENSQLKSQIAELSLEYASLRTALVRDL
ncbi:MAG: transposase [Nitrospira sp. CR1.1]|jgi:putative transposase|nr:transposase [Nitrospira sp. CR1.1]